MERNDTLALERLRAHDPARPPSEYAEQVAVCQWLARARPDVFWFAIPNGGSRHLHEAVKLKNSGVRPGVPDLFVAAARPPWQGLFLEMKRRSGSTVSPAQRKVMAVLEAAGYRAAVCRGADEAVKAIEEYLG
ncbi:MAG: VRR-NUC domain-containing protein [Deltaproteobacteria bacterium]|jgi:hypothetical protein|nr:VRR-NUC domain-containing protein [Deltaproteobacteria bacterium]